MMTVSDENVTEEINQKINIAVEESTTTKKVGTPRNMTKEVIQVKKYLQKQEDERLVGERGIRRSSRVKTKRAMKCSDEKIPGNVTEAKSFEWAHWKKAMNDEMAS